LVAEVGVIIFLVVTVLLAALAVELLVKINLLLVVAGHQVKETLAVLA
jgi:hypothetical protein